MACVITGGMGWTGLMNGVFGQIVAYSVGVNTNPKCPCAPPPNVVLIDPAFAFNSFFSWIKFLKLGRSKIGVHCNN